jgi:putative ABC transport system substrate-binding protein
MMKAPQNRRDEGNPRMFDIRRREFITLLGGAAAVWPLGANAQRQDGARRIGILMPAADAQRHTDLTALEHRLAELGWVKGRNLVIEYRWGGGDIERTRIYAAELVRGSPDVILACFSAQLAPLSRETNTIPIIFVGVSDPLGSGYVASFARPGGNITGFTMYEPSIAGKWLGTLKEIAPSLKRVGLMTNPDTATLQGKLYLQTFELAARSFTVNPLVGAVRSVGDIDAVMTAFAHEAETGLIVAPETFTETNADLIVSLAAQHRLPAIYGVTHFPKQRGGLVSYGPDTTDIFRRAALYMDRILRGERPAELPIQTPTKLDLVINLKTAKALNLTIPPSLLIQAAEVIE